MVEGLGRNVRGAADGDDRDEAPHVGAVAEQQRGVAGREALAHRRRVRRLEPRVGRRVLRAAW
jgi:hypothetical protein